MAQSAPDHQTSPSGPWPADQAVEDLLAQLHELRQQGADDDALTLAMQREGLEAEDANAVIAAAQLPVIADESKRALRFGVDLSEVRRPLRLALTAMATQRADAGPEQLALAAALRASGVDAGPANSIAHELVDQVVAERAVKVKRLRRLGWQAMVAGCVFAVFFTAAGSQPLRGAKWHWMTAGLSVAMAAYGAAVYRRSRLG
ncbi:MAG: hypothetical protein EXR77_13285 [Myxococcales bacterium]|nr:hypothetical protein [Myxococcales bacterium]